jgi:hypothetical protein
VGAWTSKQAIVTKSSTEAELVGVTDGGIHAIWFLHFLIAQGYPSFAFVVFQDNTSVLALFKSEQGPSQRTKYLDIRYWWGAERARAGELVFLYKPTKEMIADVLTKPLVGALFIVLSDRMLGIWKK